MNNLETVPASGGLPENEATGRTSRSTNSQSDLQLGDDRNSVIRLLMASGLMLFLELALIRWFAANVVHLSYFSNFVLLGSFLGIGTGFLISRKTGRSGRRRCRC